MEKRTAERENPFLFFCFSKLLSRWNGTTEADLLFQKGMEKVHKYEGAESMPRGDSGAGESGTSSSKGGSDALRTGDSKVISSMSKEQLQANLPDGWTYTEHNGRVHIKDANGNFRVCIDPPDKVTSYQHMHILDELGNPLDIDGNIVSPKSPDGHIPWDN